MTTAVTEPLVDAKDDAVKAELRLDMAQAIAELLMAVERQNVVIERLSSEHAAAFERLRLEHAAAFERLSSEHAAAFERLRLEHAAAIERQGLEHVAAIERQGAHYERRLSVATYWLFGAIVAGHLTTIGVVISLLT